MKSFLRRSKCDKSTLRKVELIVRRVRPLRWRHATRSNCERIAVAVNPHRRRRQRAPEPEPEERPVVVAGGQEPKQERVNYRPTNGLTFAKMAVSQLERIHTRDRERKEAFEYVAAWISKQQGGAQ